MWKNNHAEEQKEMLQLSQNFLKTLEPSEVMQKAVEASSQVLKADAASLLLLEENQLILRAATGWATSLIGLALSEESGPAWAVVEKQPVAVRDVRKEKRFRLRPEALKAGVLSCLVVPMLVGDRAIGVMEADWLQEHRFTDQEVRLFSLIANQVALALDRLRAIEDLRRSEENYRQIVTLAAEGIWRLDKDAFTTYVNPRMAEMLGYTADEMIGRHLFDFMDEETRSLAGRYLERCKSGIREVHEFTFQRKDGTPIHTKVSASPLYAPDGSYVGALRIVTDISDIKQAEEAIRRHAAELEMRNRVLQAILSTLDLEERLDITLKEALDFAGADMGAVALVSRDRLIVKAHRNIPEDLLAEIRDVALETIPWAMEKTLGRDRVTERLPGADEVARRHGIRSWLYLPLRIKDRLLGAILLLDRRLDAFSEETVEALENRADNVSLAVENARLYAESRERLARLTTLREIDRAISANLSLDQIIKTVLERTLPHIKVDGVGLSLLDWERKRPILARMHLREGARIEGEAFQLSESLLTELAERKETVIIYDVQTDPRVQNHRDIIRKYGLRSYMGVPLVVRDEAIGMLHLFTTTPHRFADEEVAFFKVMAGQAAISVQNARMYEAAVQRAAGMKTLADLTLNLAEFDYEEEVASKILQAACEVIGADLASYFAYDEESKTFGLVGSVGFLEDKEKFERAKSQLALPLGEERGLVGLVGYTRKPLYLPDLRSDPRWIAIDPTLRSGYWVPLHHGERLFGVYVLFSREVDGFSPEQRALADTFATYASTALDNARLFRETQQAYEELRTTQRQLLQAQKMEAIGLLAGGIAHDFNNILTVIMGHAQLASRKLPEDDPLYRDLNSIQKSAARAADLIRKLLIFSRRQPMEFVPLNLNDIVRDMLKMLARLIGEDIAIHTDLAPDLWTMQADPSNIEQVIMNLAVNARDAMPKGGDLFIRTENVRVDKGYCETHPEARPGKFVCLSVEDTGIGMDEATMERIFEPFFSTKGPRGTGLGLAMVYGIVKSHEGWIEVYSEPGQGSTFRVYLPAVSTSSAQEEGKETIPLETPQGKDERILLVEDEEGVREFITRVLRENNYVVFVAASAKEALDIFEKEKGDFDLVFSDVVLPDEKGTDLVDQFLAEKPGLRVLLTSGYTDERSDWQKIRERGHLLLQKPYSTYDLLCAVRKALEVT